jgi:hypothetical protein
MHVNLIAVINGVWFSDMLLLTLTESKCTEQNTE